MDSSHWASLPAGQRNDYRGVTWCSSGFNPMLTMLAEAWDELSRVLHVLSPLTWRGVTAHVVRGNSLSMKTFEEA